MDDTAVSAPPAAPRQMRADARRNRQRVLDSARAVFAQHGLDAQMDEIARRAEVGVGTVYRHFPTKEALAEALVGDSFERIELQARAALDEPDPWVAFAGTLWFGAELLAGNRGLTESMVTLPAEMEAVHATGVHETMAELIARGQRAGVLRADLWVEDIPVLMCGVGAATQKSHPSPDSWRRHLSIILDGLRKEAATGVLPDCRP